MSTAAVAQDIPGSADHPFFTRARDAVITWYEVQRVAAYRVAVGPVTGYQRIDEWVDVEGQLTRISYTLKSDRQLAEVHSSYVDNARRAGFEILAEGLMEGANVTGGIGHRGFLAVHYKANPTPRGATSLLEGSPSSGGSGYLAARLARPAGDIYLVVGTTQYKQDEIVSLVDVIEIRGGEIPHASIDAGTMSNEIELHGKVPIYGVVFEQDKTSISRESEATLDEIAKLLKTRRDLRLYVVVHTDMTEDLQHSVRLSQGRAETVVNALVKDYGIARERLEPHGVGPLAPATENESEPGRRKNRRVELVAR